jgi:uncharacterized protein YxeA
MKRLVATVAGVFFITSGAWAQAGSAAQEKKPAEKSSAASSQKTEKTTGVVTSVSGTSVTIKAASGEMTFAIDSETKVIGKGASTKSREKQAAGEKTVITDFVSNGDKVQVTYHDMGTTKHAATVRVTTKGS